MDWIWEFWVPIAIATGVNLAILLTIQLLELIESCCVKLWGNKLCCSPPSLPGKNELTLSWKDHGVDDSGDVRPTNTWTLKVTMPQHF